MVDGERRMEKRELRFEKGEWMRKMVGYY